MRRLDLGLAVFLPMMAACTSDSFSSEPDAATDATDETDATNGTDATDSGVPEASCSATITMQIPVAADTFLLDSQNNPNPSIRNGAAPNMNVGQAAYMAPGAGASRGLIRFALSTAMQAALQPDGGLTKAVLNLTIAPASMCTCQSGATTFDVYAVSDQWNEGDGATYNGAEWFNRFQTTSGDGVKWQAPGADGTQDRSTVSLGSASVGSPGADGGPLEVALTLGASQLAAIGPWLSGGNLSLLLVPTSGGTLFLYSREGLASATTLSLTACQ